MNLLEKCLPSRPEYKFFNVLSFPLFIMDALYSVPTIPQNLRREETIVQIADFLSYLEEVANDIFGRINARVAKNTTQLNSISNRMESARAKVSKLVGAKKATQVFSSCKYPASDTCKRYDSVFNHGDEKLSLKRSHIRYKDIQAKEEALETLQFYHVKVTTPANDRKATEGLGMIPRNTQFLNDLILYNTGNSPYQNYVMSDPLQVSHVRAKRNDTTDATDIGAAPASILERTTSTKVARESYFYAPDLGDVPAIDVPLDLPDLPGIADDFRYTDEIGPTIAPSVTALPDISIPYNPDVSKIEPLASSSFIDSPVITTSSAAISTTTTVSNEKENVSMIDIKTDIPELPVVEDDPVVVDKTEPLVIHESQDDGSDCVAQQKPVQLKSDNAHASLMDAIRKAGGSRNLRSTESKTAQTVRFKNPISNKKNLV